jgi:3-phenylpropionate/trans-cinnamate dioxygenase ferredoxin subunit
MARHVVAPVNELPPGTRRSVSVGGRRIAVFNVAGRFYAVKDVCPHQGAALSDGVVVGELTACRPGEYAFDADRPHVKCPWHGWEYDLATGRSVYDPDHDRVRSYRVETITTAVEDDYLVIVT